MGHRAEKQMYGSMKRMPKDAPKPRWQPPKIGNTGGDPRSDAPRTWKPRHLGRQ